MRIVIIEDEDVVARTLERQLYQLGHACVRVTNVQSFLSEKSDFEPQIIISDIFMPEVEGLSLIRRLRETGFGRVPIIAISGGGTYLGGIKSVQSSFVSKAAIAFGANVFLPKPITLSDLKNAIDHCQSCIVSD